MEPRAKGRKRTPGGFEGSWLKLPASVILSPGFRALSPTARALLVDIGSQFKGKNNGRLVACRRALEPLGWTSNATITKKVRELVDNGLLIVTRQGGRHHATLYALPWQELIRFPDFDPGTAEAFAAHRRDHEKPADQKKIPAPPRGAKGGLIAPPRGAQGEAIAPPRGAVRGGEQGSIAPPRGAYIDSPSARESGVVVGGAT